MWKCANINCQTENNDSDSFCIECGCAKPQFFQNSCSNPNCKEYRKILANPKQKYCGKCGSLTTFGLEIAKCI